MRPGCRNAFHHCLNGELHILGQAGCTPAVTLQHLGVKAHAGTAKTAGKAHVVLCQAPYMVNNPEGNCKYAAYPGISRVFGIHIALDNAFAVAQTAVHLLQEVGMHQVIGIENANCIILLIQLEQSVEHPCESKALALTGFAEALMHQRAGLACNLRSFIRAVVRNNIDII